MYFHYAINFVVYFMTGFLSCLIFIEFMKKYNNKKR